jgi:ribosomal protein S18 acetylase RimI-like enzyme
MRTILPAIPDRSVLIQTESGLLAEYSSSIAEVLSSDPAARPQQSDRNHSDTPSSQETCLFPGVVVRRRSTRRILAVAGCAVEPDRTISTTLPVLFSPASWKEHQPLISTIFSALQIVAEREHARGIHCLVPRQPDTRENSLTHLDATHLMRFSGLECVTEIVRLQKQLDVDSETRKTAILHPDESISMFPASEELPPESPDSLAAAGPLRPLLERILQNSEDLPDYMRPDASQLVATWELRRAIVLQLRISGHARGVAALSGIIRQGSDESPKPWILEDCSGDVSLEYIGIDPDVRRQALGRRLMQLLESQVLEIAQKTQLSKVTIGAFADYMNSPAMNLYRSLGYVSTEQFGLYFRSTQNATTASQIPDPAPGKNESGHRC